MVLATTLWVAVWWITEAVPIPAASLLPIVLLPLTGALEGAAVTSSYGDPIVFLFLGGFLIALAMERWNLHKRIALNIISVVGTSTSRIVLGFMAATGFLSMWVSNTAAVMMMLPIGTAIIHQVSAVMKSERKDLAGEEAKFSKALIFSIGYAGTIGGLGTLIGTPPNIILAANIKKLYGVEVSFGVDGFCRSGRCHFACSGMAVLDESGASDQDEGASGRKRIDSRRKKSSER